MQLPKQVVLDQGFVDLVARTGHPGLSVVNAARCSYGSESDNMEERDKKLVRYLLEHGHTSPFRHAFFTFHIKAPLFMFRQWWKYQVGSTWREYEIEDGQGVLRNHLASGKIVAADIQIDTDQGCSWNELSGRYKVMEPEFYVPEHDRWQSGRQASERYEGDQEEADELLRGTLQAANDDAMGYYRALLQRGTARELARLVLPPTIYSECYWTVSLQAVLHFLDQRLKPEAQYEIRMYAQAVLELIRPSLEEMGIIR